jgi:hypothetical protein
MFLLRSTGRGDRRLIAVAWGCESGGSISQWGGDGWGLLARAMSFPKIVYFGPSGLDADIFRAYMASSGFNVQLAPTREDALAAVKADPTAITVIALDKPPPDLIKLARDVRARTLSEESHIFILAGSQPFDPGVPSVEVIPRPFRLAELSRRIQSLARQLAGGPN